MFEVTASILGTPQIAFGLDNLLKKIEDFRPIWPELTTTIHRIIGRHYDAEGAFSPGGIWPPLSPRYAAWKREHYPGRPILVREGRLRASLTQKGAPDSHVDGSAPMRLEVTTLTYYAIFHQTGVPSRNLPMRRPVDLLDEDQLTIARVFQRYVNTDALKMKGSQYRLPFGESV